LYDVSYKATIFWISLKGADAIPGVPLSKGGEEPANGPPFSTSLTPETLNYKGFIPKQTFNGFTNISQRQYCLWTLEELLEFV